MTEREFGTGGRENQAGPCDPEAFARLRRWGGERLVRDMVALFLTQVPERLAAVRQALRQGDISEAERAAHALRSSSAQLGAVRMEVLCAQAERCAAQGDVGAIPASIDQLEREFVRFVEWLPRTARERGDDRMKTIALVEDNADNRLLVQAILEDRYRIDEYEDGHAALKGLRDGPPDLVLLDISLPETDGVEVLREIRADEELRHLPVIALTAHAMAGDRERFLAAGFDAYVMKPITDEELLLDAIDQLLRG